MLRPSTEGSALLLLLSDLVVALLELLDDIEMLLLLPRLGDSGSLSFGVSRILIIWRTRLSSAWSSESSSPVASGEDFLEPLDLFGPGDLRGEPSVSEILVSPFTNVNWVGMVVLAPDPEANVPPSLLLSSNSFLWAKRRTL